MDKSIIESSFISQEIVERKIYVIRKKKVMVDHDLASLYNVSTKALNQAVKRNIKRFPADFMFQLNKKEKTELVTNCDRFKGLKHSTALPYAFTELGVAMLSSVLRSEKAIRVNIVIMRTFAKIREIILANKELAQKLNELESKVGKHDVDIRNIFDAIRQLMMVKDSPKRQIGFHAS